MSTSLKPHGVDLANAISADLEKEVCAVCHGAGEICMNCWNVVDDCECGELEFEVGGCGECEGEGLVSRELRDD